MSYYNRRRRYGTRQKWSSVSLSRPSSRPQTELAPELKKLLEKWDKEAAASRAISVIKDDVKRLFFALESQDLGKLFKLYEVDFGESSRRYAETTFFEWKRGTVQVSGKVAERLVRLVPKVLSTEAKYYLIEKLWQHYKTRSHVAVTVHPDKDIRALVETLATRIDQSLDHRIPEPVMESLGWLYDADSSAIQRCLRSVAEAEAQVVGNGLLAHVEELRSRAQQCLESADFIGHVRFSLPFADVSVTIRKQWASEAQREHMNNQPSQDEENKHSGSLVPHPEKQVGISNPNDLLSELTKGLPKSQVDQLKGKAAEELLRIHVKEKEQRMDREAMANNVGDAIKAARVLNMEDNSGYVLKTEHLSATSKTSVTIQKGPVNPAPTDDRKRVSARCFVATVCYGAEDNGNVETLRRYRDRYLCTKISGRAFVSLYYRCGPHLARFVVKHESIRRITRTALDGIVARLRRRGF